KVNRVELKNIMPPQAIRDAMERQMKAERERRESILKAEGEKKSAVLIAEGEKESLILRAEAKKEAEIREAEGKARAIIEVQKAVAEGIKLINEADPKQGYLTIKSLESLNALADGKATKIVVPSDLQGIAGLATSVAEVIKEK
ncbi:MAG: SPFH/Band 7/PHB domain protein, partial [Clostridiales bacterium]|nr:SPFH/Band 7/PHB domain protein [Clostridiales bacterium]MDD6565069.1 SPFH/Band 7/PHB domain protein [Clostridiales bacterium]